MMTPEVGANFDPYDGNSNAHHLEQLCGLVLDPKTPFYGLMNDTLSLLREPKDSRLTVVAQGTLPGPTQTSAHALNKFIGQQKGTLTNPERSISLATIRGTWGAAIYGARLPLQPEFYTDTAAIQEPLGPKSVQINQLRHLRTWTQGTRSTFRLYDSDILNELSPEDRTPFFPGPSNNSITWCGKVGLQGLAPENVVYVDPAAPTKEMNVIRDGDDLRRAKDIIDFISDNAMTREDTQGVIEDQIERLRSQR